MGALSVDVLDSASFAGLGAFSLGAFAFGAFSLATAFAFRAFSLGAFSSGAFGAVFLLAGVTSAGFSSSALAGAFSLGAASTAILGAFSFVATLGLAASTGNFALFSSSHYVSLYFREVFSDFFWSNILCGVL